MTGEGWSWRGAARCRTDNANNLFVRGAKQRDARVFCRPCPVRTECLAHALDARIEWGVWGGMTERERRALLRRRPDVKSWTVLLYAARQEHYISAEATDSDERSGCYRARPTRLPKPV
ncbi:WhiB family transcriptional regulator [Pseudonocardia kunmingensis]|uniref:Transcriptional regulator WhiB n=1 Tax=Pseudonocardia kunmingensis TaxID=630975 RepID=A0A543CWX0_9PSEU|nr:WhiB family transcriptional regulator [Pseudonocardia kunmingensis]TQM01604.1 transcription factor WhiB [Pseudonocardia kunmingensis]